MNTTLRPHKILYTLITLLSVLLGFQQRALASHAMGADISYACIGPDQYEVTVSFYRDCFGINAPNTVSLDVTAPGCGSSMFVTATQDTLFLGSDFLVSGTEVSPLCPDDLPNSTCNGGTLPGVEIYVYKAIITLPSECTNWTVSFAECCRNAAIDNLFNADAFDLYVEATINNTGGLCNNSVVFTSLPVPFICTGQPFNFNHGAVDPDGDSLVYTMIQPLDAASTPIVYAVGYSLTDPLTTVSGFTFDPVTGSISFTPDVEQVGVVTVLVEEWRAGVIVGTTIRDIQITVLDCDYSAPPEYSGNFDFADGAVIEDSVTLNSCPGDTLQFGLTFLSDSIGDSLELTTNASLALPGSSILISGANPVTLDVQWITSLLDTGFYVFTVTVNNGACPLFNQQTFTFSIDIIPGTFAGPDKNFCPGGVPAGLSAEGGSSFLWTPAAGLDDPNAQYPNATPAVTTTYIVTSDISDFCRNMDTVIVTVVPPFTYTISPDDSICKFATTTIGVNPDGSGVPYTYEWDPVDGLSDPAAATTDATPLVPTNYIITMTSDTGCIMADSVFVDLQGISPQFNAVTDISALCPLDVAQLQMAPSCAIDETGGCPPGSEDMIAVQPETLITGAQTPYKGGYDDSRMQILYTGEDMNEAGFYGGIISELSFFVAEKTSSAPYENFTIKMSCTELEELTDSFVNVTNIVYGPIDYSTISGWNTHTLDVPYSWDGQTNLIFEICFDNPHYGFTGDDKVYYSNVAYNSTVVDFNLLESGCSMNISPTASNKRPNIRFTYCSQDFSGIDITWAPPGGLSDPGIQNPLADPDSDVTYVVTADDNGCISTDTLSLTVDNSLTLDAGADLSICQNTDVQLMANAVGDPPSGGFIFLWTPFTGLSDPNISDPVASPDVTTTYTVSTISENGCLGIDTIVVSILATNPEVGPETSICLGETIQLNADGGISYEWLTTDGLSCTDCPDPVVSPTSTQPWTVVIESADGCLDTVSTVIIVNPLPYVDAGSDTTIFAGESTVLDGTFGTSYQWDPCLALNDCNIQNPVANPLETTTYTLTLTDGNGCVNTDQVTVNVNDVDEIFVPTAFSPNGDGINDVFMVIDRGLLSLVSMQIYNRWGELIYEGNDLKSGWDGTFKGEEQEMDTYIWAIEVLTLANRTLSGTGHVTLVR